MQLIPAILESDLTAVEDKLAQVLAQGDARRVQLDITDGNLVPQLTVTPADLAQLDFGDLAIDWHLMTEDPLDYVWEILSQGKALVTHGVFGQIERLSEPISFLQAVREQNWEAGIALDYDTPLDSLQDFSWDDLESVLLLAVPMGQQGQVLGEQIWQKIAGLQQLMLARGKMVKIYVDGGLKEPQLQRLVAMKDIHAAVVGSFYFQN